MLIIYNIVIRRYKVGSDHEGSHVIRVLQSITILNLKQFRWWRFKVFQKIEAKCTVKGMNEESESKERRTQWDWEDGQTSREP